MRSTTLVFVALCVAVSPVLAQDGPLILLPPGQTPAEVPPPSPVVQAPQPDSPLSLSPSVAATPPATAGLDPLNPAPPLPRLNPRKAGATTTVALPNDPMTGLIDGQPLPLPILPSVASTEGELPASTTASLPPLTSAPPPVAGGTELLPLPTDRGAPLTQVSNGGAKDAGEVDLAYGAFQRGFYLSAFSLAIPRAEKGDVAAQTLLGLIYEGGYGVPQNLEEAVAWYEFAAAGGEREAQFALGMMYLDGRGVERDRSRAADYLEMAAGGDKTTAKYNLALLYLEGQVRPPDIARAAELFGEAAEAGSPDAQYVLAQLYADGRGVPADEVASTQWFAEAARLGHVEAQVEYGIRLFNGVGTTKNEQAAALWFRRAADLGSPVAQNRYARILATGRGAALDLVQAAKYHLLAVNSGKTDDLLDDMIAGLSDEQRRTAVAAAQRWPAD